MTGLWEAARLRHDILYFVIRLLPTREAVRPVPGEAAEPSLRCCALARSLRKRSSAYFLKPGCRRDRTGSER
jgi:hypothetical protein